MNSPITVAINLFPDHFFSLLLYLLQVCQPIMAGGTNCSHPSNAMRYIEEFTCAGVGSSERMLKEMRLSFPSGHASASAYTMIFCAVSFIYTIKFI